MNCSQDITFLNVSDVCCIYDQALEVMTVLWPISGLQWFTFLVSPQLASNLNQGGNKNHTGYTFLVETPPQKRWVELVTCREIKGIMHPAVVILKVHFYRFLCFYKLGGVKPEVGYCSYCSSVFISSSDLPSIPQPPVKMWSQGLLVSCLCLATQNMSSLKVGAYVCLAGKFDRMWKKTERDTQQKNKKSKQYFIFH